MEKRFYISVISEGEIFDDFVKANEVKSIREACEKVLKYRGPKAYIVGINEVTLRKISLEEME